MLQRQAVGTLDVQWPQHNRTDSAARYRSAGPLKATCTGLDRSLEGVAKVARFAIEVGRRCGENDLIISGDARRQWPVDLSGRTCRLRGVGRS